MKTNRIITCLAMLAFIIAASSFNAANHFQTDPIAGAWQMEDGTNTFTWIFIDGYAVGSVYDKTNKRFVSTSGGPYQLKDGQLTVHAEFNTQDSTKVGQQLVVPVTISNNEFVMNFSNHKLTYKRLDNGTGALAGNWRISGRMQDGKIVESRPGPRKTLKLLSGTRFQWVAINPEVKGFYGTGGGTYTFTNGKYTENIEFFSRDNSRVGASLTFDGKIEDGAWHHSGLSSRGEPLNEIWKRVK
ncbi:MAG TPA: hypothetical protein VD993_07090 [Chitinophagaceae bacterium]|nr:hypothetical protein [Chitinophagaceae bacterium]